MKLAALFVLALVAVVSAGDVRKPVDASTYVVSNVSLYYESLVRKSLCTTPYTALRVFRSHLRVFLSCSALTLATLSLVPFSMPTTAFLNFSL